MKLNQLYFATYYSPIGDINLVVFVSKSYWNKYKDWDEDYEEIQELVGSSFPNLLELVHETIYRPTVKVSILRKHLLKAGLIEQDGLI